MTKHKSSRAYHAGRVHLTKHQVAALAHGRTVRIPPHHIAAGHHTYHLTKTQVKHLHQAKRLGKHAHLKMSKSQVTHNLRHGAGFFDFLKKSVGTVTEMAKPYLRPLLTKGAELGGQFLQDQLKQRTGLDLPVASLINKGAEMGMDKAGLGLRRHRRRSVRRPAHRPRRGGSFYAGGY